MKKIERLLEEHPERINQLINDLYSELYPRSPKTGFKFIALGKKYDENIATKNYVNFITDITKITEKSTLSECLGSYVKNDPSQFPHSVKLGYKEIRKITEDTYISTNTSTEKKINHVENICEKLGIKIELI